MGLAHVNGIELAYHIEGTGIPCLVARTPSPVGMKPIVEPSILERTLSPRLREHLQLIFFDFRGTGDSGGTPEAVTLDQLIDDLEQLRQALGFERVAMVGWSMLSLFALDFAKAYPASISHLILIGGHTHFGPRDDRYWDQLASDERKAILAANNARLDPAAIAALPAGRAWILQTVANAPRYWYDPTFNWLPLFADDVFDVTFLDRLVQELQAPHPDVSAIEGISTPIFSAEGVWDFICPPIYWHDVIKTYPNCSYHAFERSGHYPFYEEQELFDAKLIDWISQGADDDRPERQSLSQ